MCGQDILQPWGKPYCYMEVSGLTSSRASHSFDEQSVHRIAGGQELLGKKAGPKRTLPGGVSFRCSFSRAGQSTGPRSSTMSSCCHCLRSRWTRHVPRTAAGSGIGACKELQGTGVVTSVPSDSPDDYAAYMDLMKSGGSCSLDSKAVFVRKVRAPTVAVTWARQEARVLWREEGVGSALRLDPHH